MIRASEVFFFFLGMTVFSFALGAIAVSSCVPAHAVYGAERLACVSLDAATAARECMRLVDQKYGQDGGLNGRD